MGRRGLRNREWAVEWEDSAIEFLLEKGFTKDMGARPLRRAIDQHVLAPNRHDHRGAPFPRGRPVPVRARRRQCTAGGPDNSGGFDRVVVRVRVVPQPAAPQPRQQSQAAQAAACLGAAPADTTIVRRYRAEPSPLVRDAQDGWRTGRLDLVLGGDFDLMQERREER